MEHLPISSSPNPQIVFELSEIDLIPIDRDLSAEKLT